MGRRGFKVWAEEWAEVWAEVKTEGFIKPMALGWMSGFQSWFH